MASLFYWAKNMTDDYYFLDQKNTDPKRIKAEREKARKLRKTSWWNEKLQRGLCHYCEQKFKPEQLTMDHLVPLARGGLSVKSNLVPACKECNAKKKLHTPVDLLFQQLENEKKGSNQ
jgi:5-methylcytosine-specific restriction protein A